TKIINMIRLFACPESNKGMHHEGNFGDRLKLLYFDGQGFCLYYKVLQKGRFPWPSAADGTARLTSAQMAMLWERIDWRRPNWGAPPARVG
ncbi:IS66 family insertion sequence element accessory protein TnpB, partial [Mesorhizobium sp.]|uniref:IS66 family insertion sequence element accessory protein TnpB n=1 Tax=Mesorhizobium sp. TaxID=1871066 RepID=UPI0025CBD01D